MNSKNPNLLKCNNCKPSDILPPTLYITIIILFLTSTPIFIYGWSIYVIYGDYANNQWVNGTCNLNYSNNNPLDIRNRYTYLITGKTTKNYYVIFNISVISLDGQYNFQGVAGLPTSTDYSYFRSDANAQTVILDYVDRIFLVDCIFSPQLIELYSRTRVPDDRRGAYFKESLSELNVVEKTVERRDWMIVSSFFDVFCGGFAGVSGGIADSDW